MIYTEVKQRISHENSQAKVIFLECPFLSVYRWNKHQGREYNTQSEEIDKKQDTELKSIIKYFNNQLNLINRDWTTDVCIYFPDFSVSSHVPNQMYTIGR
jgi:hypothetical protein